MATAPPITTPSIVAAKLRQADGEIRALWDAVFQWHKTQSQVDLATDFEPYRKLFNEWREFHDDKPSTLWGATFDAAEAFRSRASELWDRARARGVPGLPPRPTPDEKASPALFLGLTGATLVLVIVAIIVARRALA